MKNSCDRTGKCCTRFFLPYSPKQLREWVQDGGLTNYQKVDMIYDMVGDRCQGKMIKKENIDPKFLDIANTYYVYGPCRWLKWEVEDNKLVSICKAQKFKPPMCSGYPRYIPGDERENPGEFRGCGYNEDPKRGFEPEWLDMAVIPLDRDEL